MPFGSSYLIAVLIGVALGLFVFAVFMPPRKRGKYFSSPSLLVLHDYLNFKKMIAIWFVKLGYVVSACVLTIYAIIMMFDVNFFVGLGALIIGNIVLRIVQELSIVMLSIHSNLNILTDKFTGRTPDDVADVSIGQFFGDMGSQIKQKQEQMRARAEAERQQYGQQGGQQYQQQYQQPPAQQYAPPQQQGYPPPPQNTYGSAPTQPPPPPSSYSAPPPPPPPPQNTYGQQPQAPGQDGLQPPPPPPNF